MPAQAWPPELLVQQLPNQHSLESSTSQSVTPQQLVGSSSPAVCTPGAEWTARVAVHSCSGLLRTAFCSAALVSRAGEQARGPSLPWKAVVRGSTGPAPGASLHTDGCLLQAEIKPVYNDFDKHCLSSTGQALCYRQRLRHISHACVKINLCSRANRRRKVTTRGKVLAFVIWLAPWLPSTNVLLYHHCTFRSCSAPLPVQCTSTFQPPASADLTEHISSCLHPALQVTRV